MTEETGPSTYAVPRFGAARRALMIFLLLAVGSAGAWISRDQLLRGAADLWIVSDVPGPADAVAIFGGGVVVRSAAAAAYYREGLVKKVLISNVRPDSAEALGITPSQTSLNRSAALKFGVPETAIELFGVDLSNSYEEAIALRDWALHAHVSRIIVPTQEFSSRRIRWLMDREFSGTEIFVQVPALQASDYDYREWWRSDLGILAFQNEIIKYIYYRLKY